MHINIMSCEGRNYLDTTLASLPAGAEVTVFYQYDTVPLERDDVSIVNHAKLSPLARENAAWNYAYILENGTPYRGQVLILEDDVQCCRNFQARVDEVIDRIPAPGITALYACYHWQNPGTPLRVVPYPINDFYGTQAMLFNAAVAPTAAEYVRAHMYDRAQYDMQLKEVCWQNRIPLYAAGYSLVQHIGAETTGMSAHLHQADNFIDDWFTAQEVA